MRLSRNETKCEQQEGELIRRRRPCETQGMVSSNRHPDRENEGWRQPGLASGDPCGSQVIPAAAVIDQADDGLPHDRTSLFHPTCG
jgi:hypothetical protein